MRILLLEPQGYSTRALKMIETLGPVTQGPLTRKALLDAVGIYDVLIIRLNHRIDREIFARAGQLKVIVSPSTGLDHIDLREAGERHIAVLSLQDDREFLDTVASTAEHAWGLLLALIRRTPAAHASVLAGQWNRDHFRGRELRGLTLGIVGYGRLGKMVARYGIAFGMDVMAYDPQVRTPEPPVRWVSFEEVLATAHCLSLHVPLSDQTAGLFGQREFALMVPGGYLVNTSRGAVIDEAALLHSLQTGHLGGAALDVLAAEPPSESGMTGRLLTYATDHDNLILTPHLGGATVEAMERTEIHMAEKLQQWAALECAIKPVR